MRWRTDRVDEPTWKKRGCGTSVLVMLAVVVCWLVWLFLLVGWQATP